MDSRIDSKFHNQISTFYDKEGFFSVNQRYLELLGEQDAVKPDSRNIMIYHHMVN